MSIITKVSRHAAVAQGNFAKMFRGVKIAPLPEAAAAILEEIHKPEPDILCLERIISAEPEISIRLLSNVNSSLHSLRSQVTSVRHAITLLGLDRVRALVTASAMATAVPKPKDSLFDHEAYWADTLIRSLIARELAARHAPGQQDVAFTAMLVADVAIPVLLESWSEYYRPVLEDWNQRPVRLARLEQDRYGWDHGQAGSWILKYWNFPEELVCLVAAHNLPLHKVRELGLEKTVAPSLVVAGLLPSCMNPILHRCLEMIDLAAEELGISPGTWPEIIDTVRTQYDLIHAQFGLRRGKVDRVFQCMNQVFENDRQQICR